MEVLGATLSLHANAKMSRMLGAPVSGGHGCEVPNEPALLPPVETRVDVDAIRSWTSRNALANHAYNVMMGKQERREERMQQPAERKRRGEL